MQNRFTYLIAFFLCSGISLPTFAQDTTALRAADSVGYNRGQMSWWHYAACCAVTDNIYSLYVPHANALLHSETMLLNKSKPAEVLASFDGLPGVNGVVVAMKGETSVATKSVDFELTPFEQKIYGDHHATSHPVSPMMHKKVSGKCTFLPYEVSGKTYNCMVRYVHAGEDTIPVGVVALILDPDWLLKKIPALMDSLSTENQTLLWFADSPINKWGKQRLGVVYGSDTLWWRGEPARKDEVWQPITVLDKLKMFYKVELWPNAKK